jgi:DNA-binding response OmpR family regulator
MRIMVIEDEDLLIQAIGRKLTTLGFETILCTSAKQALDYLKSVQELPQAIWLDFYLQDMNGLDFMSEIKKNSNWSEIPVFVVSNSASDEKKKKMLALGVREYFLKAQYRLDEIAAAIKKSVEEVKG